MGELSRCFQKQLCQFPLSGWAWVLANFPVTLCLQSFVGVEFWFLKPVRHN